ncbi:MAG TPA: hypothetical protein VM555_05585, partial [Tahibacter sp.]|nr:hypothetical protein [Tahibacter sp.]
MADENCIPVTDPVDDTSKIEQVIANERSVIGLEEDGQANALCLSGGGIRSATFALGVLQGLA